MSVDLIYKHQEKTYELINEQLNKTNKAAYIFPVGCGKSFPALKYIEQNPDKKVLFVSPSIGIINQFKQYISQYILDGKHVDKHTIPNFREITYSKIGLMQDMVNLKPDVIIFDEIHRMGAEKWGEGVKRLIDANPQAQIIGMSATPERTDGRNMAIENFEDSIIYEMNLTDALSGEKEGEVVLQGARYVRVLSQFQEKLGEYREKIDLITDETKRKALLEKYEKLHSIVSKAPDIQEIMQQGMKKKNGKYIVFCEDSNDMFKKMADVQNIFGKVNSKIKVDYVLSSQIENGKTRGQNTKTIEEFEKRSENDELNLLFCVDMLNEGVHIKGISGEVMFRPTESEIVYKQQIGRILSADKAAEETVIIDAVNNWYRQIDSFQELKRAIGKGHKGNEQFELFGLTSEELELLDVLKEIDENYKTVWDKQYELLKGLKEAEGDYLGLTKEQVKKEQKKLRDNHSTTYNLILKSKEQKYYIGNWVMRQKSLLNKYKGKTKEEIEQDETIEPEEKRRVLLLLELGIKSSMLKDMWNKRYELLKGLKEAQGEYLGLTQEKVKIEQEKLKEEGSVSTKLILKDEEQEYNIGRWLFFQKDRLINKYMDKNKEEIQQNETIDPEEKRRVLLLLELGIKPTKEILLTPEEIWNKYYEILKALKGAKGDYYSLTKEVVNKEQEKIKEEGSVSTKLILKDEEQEYRIGTWCTHQKALLNKYRGRRKEEIEQDETIDSEEKRRVLLLLELGIKPTKEMLLTPEENWNKYYEILKGLKEAKGEYLGLTKERVKKEQDKIKNAGSITQRLKVKEGQQIYNIGVWQNDQKRIINKYRGKRKEEIEQDETIEPEEKRRVLLLLELGLKPSKERVLTPEEIWDKQYELLKGLKEAKGEYCGLSREQVKKEQQKLKEEGSISQKVILKKEQQEHNIGRWFYAQKYSILNKYIGKTEEEIKLDETIDPEEKRRLLLLLELDVKVKTKPIRTWDKQYGLLKGLKEAEREYCGLSREQVEKEQEKLKETGRITKSLQFKVGKINYKIGAWVRDQKKLLNKYRGKTEEEIKLDETIDPEEKRRIILLIELGITSSKEIKSQDLGKAGFEVGIGDVEKCDEAQKILSSLVEKTKEGGINKNE